MLTQKLFTNVPTYAGTLPGSSPNLAGSHKMLVNRRRHVTSVHKGIIYMKPLDY